MNKKSAFKNNTRCNLGKIQVVILAICFTILCLGCGTKEAKLENGTYVADVTMEGGSGRATVESPARITVENEVITVTIRWSSPNYDYMIVGETRYDNEAEPGENSCFTFPIDGFDQKIEVIADTIAMSKPHEITYQLTFTLTDLQYEDIAWQEEITLSYATQFSVQKSEEYALITIVDSGRFLLVKEDSPVPVGLPEDVTVLKQPLDHIYLVSSSVVDLFRELGCLTNLRLLGIQEDNLYIEEAKEALQDGRILYAGKYSAPDYEMILQEGCDLAIENTMILHDPQTKEKLEQLGIPVLVERSSYENHPLGRLEWIKLYGILLGKEQEANAFFENQIEQIEPILHAQQTDRKVTYFYVNSNGVINVRKPNDYIAKMITMAGGQYALSEVIVEEENALSTMNMQMEDFYVAAKDADVLIYNSTIDGEINSLEDLFEKNELFRDFKAVQTGEVYCTSSDFFQESTGLGVFLQDLYQVIQGNTEAKYTYLKKIS